MHRLQVLQNQTSPGLDPDAVVICAAKRSPITKAKRGAFKDLMPEDLLVPVIKAVIQESKVAPERIEEVCIGNVLQVGSGSISTRMAALLAGLPVTTPVHTVNRQCSSGLQAVAHVAHAILAGSIDIGIGGGVESMSQFDMTDSLNPEKLSQEIFKDEKARNCLLPMGMTSEILAKQFNVTREMQDKMAVESHAKAAAATNSGYFKEEIVPIQVKNEKTGKSTIVDRDEGIRPQTSLETLSKLKPAFEAEGSTTAGNSSQVSDGAAAVLLARYSVAKALNLPILARFVAFSCVGVDPRIMGIGPAYAIPKVLEKANLKMGDIDIFELNEAFASQACYCVSKLGIPASKLNPKGGAIALGHPLGCTGARQISTLLPELRRRKKRYGVVAMCIGTGMGAAAVIENLKL